MSQCSFNEEQKKKFVLFARSPAVQSPEKMRRTYELDE